MRQFEGVAMVPDTTPPAVDNGQAGLHTTIAASDGKGTFWMGSRVLGSNGSAQAWRTMLANPLEMFKFGMRILFGSLMFERLSENDGIVTRYMSDKAIRNAVRTPLARKVYETMRKADKPTFKMAR